MSADMIAGRTAPAVAMGHAHPFAQARAQAGSQEAATQAEIRARVREAVDRAREAQARAEEAQVRAQDAARAAGNQRINVAPPPTRIIVQDGRVIAEEIIGPTAVSVGGSGASGTIAPRQGPFGPGPEIPPQAVDITYAFFFTVAVIAIGVPLVRAFARWLDRRGSAPAAVPADLTQRLDRIETAVEAMATEVERIAEGQRFTSKLMAELRQLPQLESAPRVPERRG